MSLYRIADLNVAYTPQHEDIAAFLAPYQIGDTAAHLTVQLSPSSLKEEAALLPAASDSASESAALLRVLSRQLPAFDRLVLHAATVVKDDAAYAFIAPSGTGKTTHVQLWQKRFADHVYILNGDRLFVHIQSDGVTAFGSPWCGKEGLGQNAHAPLKGLFVLTRSDRAHCAPLSPADALPHLLRATLFPKTQAERLATLSLLERLTALTPLYHLHAPLSFAAVDAALESSGGTP